MRRVCPRPTTAPCRAHASLRAVAVLVRDVRPEELEQAGLVTQRAFAEFAPADTGPDGWPYLRALGDAVGRSQRTTILVAVDDSDELLGTVTLEITARIGPDDPPPSPDEVHVRMLAVAPEARGRGIGRALMEGAIATARRLGRSRVTLHTGDQMAAAQNLYRHLGFERLPDEPGHHGSMMQTYHLRLESDATRYPAANEF
jgi:ribosomal protein S18 acetylase RimI-like enzyme